VAERVAFVTSTPFDTLLIPSGIQIACVLEYCLRHIIIMAAGILKGLSFYLRDGGRVCLIT
jgi:hypothetical protein